MTGDIRFTKVKSDGSKVTLHYERERSDGTRDEYAMVSADRPAPEFDAALNALAEDVIVVCELPASDKEKLTVRGVSLSHTNDIRGAVITAMKALTTANSPLVLNTPHLPESAYSGSKTDPNPTMADGMVHRLDDLEREATRYVDGERAQGALFSAA
jgi:hypothetical protein